MTPPVETQKKQAIEAAAKAVRRAAEGAADVAEKFVRIYYADVPPGDLVGLDSKDLNGAALGFWQFVQRRKAGQPKVRVYNPTRKQHGWGSRHTVVEIVTDDMPFLIDSLTNEFNAQGNTVHLVIHPVVAVSRDKSGKLTACSDGRQPDIGALKRESLMHFEIGGHNDATALAHITTQVEKVLADVRAAVEDWPQMGQALDAALADLRANPPQVPLGEIEEAEAFLEWLAADHFTFLGYREYDHTGSGKARRLKVVPGGCGVLRDSTRSLFENWADNEALPADVQTFMEQPNILMLTKANSRSTVHRPAYMDVIGIKKFNAKGEVTGERIIAGLFTSAAYSRSPKAIPLLRRKIATAIEHAGFPPSGHAAKALEHILESYPRDELWQIDDETLLRNALGIHHLQERQRTALFIREDPFRRYVSVMVFVPRDRYDSALRHKIGGLLERHLGGNIVGYYPEFDTESVLARVLFIVRMGPEGLPAYDIDSLSAALHDVVRLWTDKLRDTLLATTGAEDGILHFERFGQAFGSGYRERYSPEDAVGDIAHLEEVRLTGELQLNLYREADEPDDAVHLKLYHDTDPVPLSDALPMLENMGLKVIGEEPFEVNYNYAGGTGTAWVHDFAMRQRSGAAVDLPAVRDIFHDAFARVFAGAGADDGFNRLVLGAGLEWRDIAILRTYCKFLLQARAPFSQAYMEETLGANPAIAGLIVALFKTRFDPVSAGSEKTGRQADSIRKGILEALDGVANLDEDRILRRFANAVEATLRTNYYQHGADGEMKPWLSVKINSRAIDDLPEPRPVKEVFVYSPRMEGCHLRGGDVARGGIRWSDRREDFRTEILGLQKAQMVKNAVIVPVGSKGGFVCKQPPLPTGDAAADREAMMAEVVACYSTLMNGMLDLTDNLVDGAIVPPVDVVRYDGDDPYLVVAADKGTATFSDIANGISEAYGFWLGDAYASGGSAGYDHKKMGITARGAWESVKRHFRELGQDIQKQDFSVIGVGDMSGDVFGNGMLLSPHIKLTGAFNHLHIFIDPDPDPKVSFKERKRLFGLKRSSWSDYNAALISQGGGVFERRAKSVKVSPQMKKAFGIKRAEVTPNELIHAMLSAQVDLLWFGGIGTYVKASRESHADADDRSNDAVRIDAAALHCRVIGEGANLGVTQHARIEFARKGGFVNTDFIDNSAGVDTSDHEVNIKIALREVVASGALTIAQRDKLLESMTDDVARLVLNDNYMQTQAISLAVSRAPDLLETQWQMMRVLERRGLLDRAIEALPDDEEIADRLAEQRGLTRPEYAVLFAYSKLSLYGELLPSRLPEDPYLLRDLARYFPEQLQQRFGAQISGHRLRREIVATYLTNAMANRMGATFAHELQELTIANPADIASAYVVARDAFQLRTLWRGIEALDNKVPAALQIEMLAGVSQLAERMTLWFLENLRRPLSIENTVERYAPGVAELAANLTEIVASADAKAIARGADALSAQGVPEALARQLASLRILGSAGDIVCIAEASGVPVIDCGYIYFTIGARLGIDWLRHAARGIEAADEWEKLALEAAINESFGHQSDLTARVLDMSGGGTLAREAANGMIDMWLEGHADAVVRTGRLLDELRAAGQIDLAMLTVANAKLRDLIAD